MAATGKVKPPVSLSEWEHHKYRGIESHKDGNFVTAETCLVAAGPPLLSQTGGVVSSTTSSNVDLSDLTAYPVGLIQGFSLGTNRQQVRVFEVGSWFDYLITGRAMGQVTVSKIFYSATNLLRVLYAYYGTTGSTNTTTINPLFSSPVAAMNALNDVYINPGSERIFVNMFSDLFRNPIGLMFIMTSTQNNYVGSFYLERAVIHGHNMAFDAQGLVIQENATISFGNIKSIYIEQSDLLSSISNAVSNLDI